MSLSGNRYQLFSNPWFVSKATHMLVHFGLALVPTNPNAPRPRNFNHHLLGQSEGDAGGPFAFVGC